MTKTNDSWRERFDERFPDGLYNEERNPDWIKKREEKWKWVSKTEDVEDFIQSELDRRDEELIEELEELREICRKRANNAKSEIRYKQGKFIGVRDAIEKIKKLGD